MVLLQLLPEEILNLKFLNKVIILVIKVHVVNVDGIAPAVYIPSDKILKLKLLNRFIMPLCH